MIFIWESRITKVESTLEFSVGNCGIFTTLLLGRSPPARFLVQFFDIGGALSKRLAVPDVYSRRRRAYLIFSGPAAVPGASSSGRKGDKGGGQKN